MEGLVGKLAKLSLGNRRKKMKLANRTDRKELVGKRRKARDAQVARDAQAAHAAQVARVAASYTEQPSTTRTECPKLKPKPSRRELIDDAEKDYNVITEFRRKLGDYPTPQNAEMVIGHAKVFLTTIDNILVTVRTCDSTQCKLQGMNTAVKDYLTFARLVMP
jgi:hypothetical protein